MSSVKLADANAARNMMVFYAASVIDAQGAEWKECDCGGAYSETLYN